MSSLNFGQLDGETSVDEDNSDVVQSRFSLTRFSVVSALDRKSFTHSIIVRMNAYVTTAFSS